MSVEHSILLFKRRIVVVLDWFDEDHEIPWNYIARSGDGKYEALATHLFTTEEGKPDKAAEFSVGIFDELETAQKALRSYLKQVELLEDECNRQCRKRLALLMRDG